MIGYINSFIIGTLPVTLPLFLGIFIWRRSRMGKIKQKYQVTAIRETALLIFLFYMCAVAAATVIGYEFVNIAYNGRGFFDNINLIPLRKLREMYVSAQFGGAGSNAKRIFISNVFGNIGLFVPIGFAVPLLWDFTFTKSLFVCFLATCAIEILQLPLHRVSDVDDLILNTAGAVIGCAVYAAVRRIFPGFCEKFKPRKLPDIPVNITNKQE